MTPIIEKIRKLQEYLLEIGLAQTTLALPAPRMLALPAPSSGAAVVGAFGVAVTEDEIVDVSRDLFSSGHCSLAVQEAYKAVEKFIQKKTCEPSKSGTVLMEFVFSADKPHLAWSDRASISKMDEHKGYQRLFSGAMLGIRNPVIHEFDWIEDEAVALELLVFAQHLLRKAKGAELINRT